MAWSWTVQKFCLYLHFLNHFHWDILPLVLLIISNLAVWVLIVNQICIKLQKILLLAVCFDTLVENQTDKIKAAHGEQIFLEMKIYVAHDIEGFVLLCDIALFLLKSLSTLHAYSPSDYHLIHLVDIHRPYWIYFQVCNILKIQHNKNLLQKQPFIGVLIKRCSKNMQHIYRKTPMPKRDFNKVTLLWNHTLAWVFSSKFAAYFQSIFS